MYIYIYIYNPKNACLYPKKSKLQCRLAAFIHAHVVPEVADTVALVAPSQVASFIALRLIAATGGWVWHARIRGRGCHVHMYRWRWRERPWVWHRCGAGMGAGAGAAAAAGCAASLEFCPWTCSKACPTAMTVRLRSLPMMARISSRRGSFARGIAVSRKCYGCFDHAGASAPNAPIKTGSSPAESGSACMHVHLQAHMPAVLPVQTAPSFIVQEHTETCMGK